jgi:hypothetical protein
MDRMSTGSVDHADVRACVMPSRQELDSYRHTLDMMQATLASIEGVDDVVSNRVSVCCVTGRFAMLCVYYYLFVYVCFVYGCACAYGCVFVSGWMCVLTCLSVCACVWGIL